MGTRDDRHRGNLGDKTGGWGEGGGQNLPWALGTLIYKAVKLGGGSLVSTSP